MNEQGSSPEINGSQDPTIEKEELESIINTCVSFVQERKTDLFSHLDDKGIEELITGIQSVNILDPRRTKEPEAIEVGLDRQDLTGEIFGLLLQSGVDDPESIMIEMGILENQ